MELPGILLCGGFYYEVLMVKMEKLYRVAEVEPVASAAQKNLYGSLVLVGGSSLSPRAWGAAFRYLGAMRIRTEGGGLLIRGTLIFIDSVLSSSGQYLTIKKRTRTSRWWFCRKAVNSAKCMNVYTDLLKELADAKQKYFALLDVPMGRC